MKLQIRKRLPIELTNGNDGRTKHYGASAKFRNHCEAVLRAERLERIPFAFPVTIHIIRILGKGQRLWDSDSGLRGNAKEIIDTLTVLHWWYDDGPDWIIETRFFQCATQRETGPATIVEVWR